MSWPWSYYYDGSLSDPICAFSGVYMKVFYVAISCISR